jgi:hypothetical protein
MKKLASLMGVLLLLGILSNCEKSKSNEIVKLDAPIEKPEGLSDMSNPENASRATKISTSILRMLVSSYNTAMNQLFPALVFFGEVFKEIKTEVGTEIQMPPEGVSDGNCEVSGSFHAEIKNASSKAKQITIIFNKCRGTYTPGGKEESIADGSISFLMENPTFTGSSPDEKGWFPNKISGKFDNIMFKLQQEDAALESHANMTMSTEGNFMPQGGSGAAIPTSGSSGHQGISMDATMAGTMELSGYITLENKKMAVDYGMFLDGVNYKVTGFMEGMRVNGGWRMRDGIDTSNSFEAIYENVNMGINSAGDTWSESVSAGSTIYSKCLGGKVNVETLEKVSLTFPGCPTSGVLLITGEGKSKAVFTSQGGLTIDAGDNGSIEKTIGLCDSPEFTACGLQE